jgi:hydroxyacylglutathione hydrolase
VRICRSLALIGGSQYGLSGPLDCNIYAVKGPDGIVLIDAGAGTHTEVLLSNLREDLGDAPVCAVALTHCHVDHAAGAASLRCITGCEVLAPEVSASAIETADEEITGLARARAAGVYPSDFRFEPCEVDKAFCDYECFQAAGVSFRAIHVRGHSPDAFCLLSQPESDRWLFSGDVIFYGGILGVINSSGSDMAGYRSDLHKLADLAVEGLFPGHGLFTLRGGQAHLAGAIDQARRGLLPRQIGQGDLIF